MRERSRPLVLLIWCLRRVKHWRKGRSVALHPDSTRVPLPCPACVSFDRSKFVGSLFRLLRYSTRIPSPHDVVATRQFQALTGPILQNPLHLFGRKTRERLRCWF